MTGVGAHDKFNSCLGCPHRKPGCHSSCEGYKYRRKKLDERNEKIRKSKYERGTTILVVEKDTRP